MTRSDNPRIVLNKVSPPRLPRTLERRRLFSILDQARGRPIVWIAAPAGMGKTTLAASYLKVRKINPLWYHIDEGDADPATLFQYLGVAATTIGINKKSPLPNLTPEYLPSLPIFTRRFFENLYARLKFPGTLVLDNFQELPGDAPTQALLVLAGETLPSQMNLMILSRTEPPPAFAKLLANQSIALINADSLLLTPMETVKICGLQSKAAQSTSLKTRAQRIHRKTGGWMAGTILLLQSKQQHEEESHETTPSLDMVFHYLAKEVFESFTPETQHLLLKTAFFPSLTTEMAETITGLQQASTLLSKLHRSRYFVERHQTPSEFYRYHPLFQAFLQNLAHERLSKFTLQALLNKTAQLLESAGQPEEAMKLWQTKGDYQNCIKLTLSQAPILASQGRFQVLQRWIEAIPSNIRDQEPWLIYWTGICFSPFAPQKAKQFFIKAFENFQTVENQQGQLLALGGTIQAITNLWQDLSELDPWLERLSHLLTSTTLEQLPLETRANLASAMVQALTWRHPAHPEIDMWLHIATQHLQEISNLFHRHFIGFCIMTVLCWKGKNQAASDLLNKLRSQLRNDCPHLAQSIFYAIESMFTWYSGNFLDSRIAHEKARTLMQQEQAWLHCGNMILGHQIYLGLSDNELHLAQQAIDEMNPFASQLTGVAYAHFHFMAGWVTACEKKFTKASVHVRKALEHVLAMGVPYPEAEIRLAAAEIYLELNQESKVNTHIDKALYIGNKIKSPPLQFKGFLLKARFALFQGDHTSFLSHLQKGMEVGRKFSIQVVSFWRPDVMAELCVHAMKHGIEMDYVQGLIRRRKLVPEEPPLTISHWPWAVKISTLGRLAIEIDGKLLEWSRKAQRRPLQLLKCLIALGGNEITETRLADLLWPDADGDFAHQNFATTLHRLRKLLKYEEAILLKDKLVSLNPRYCWIDIWAWDALVSIIQTSGSSVENPSDLNQALAIYQGPFLPDEPDEPWAMWLRKRMQSQYLRLLETHIEMLRSPEHKPAVCQILEHACQIEPAARPIFEHYSQGLFKPQSKEEV